MERGRGVEMRRVAAAAVAAMAGSKAVGGRGRCGREKEGCGGKSGGSRNAVILLLS